MPTVLAVLISLLVISGCATQQPKNIEYDANLIDGTALFGEPVAAAPPEDPLWVSPEMAEFAAIPAYRRMTHYSRFRFLMKKLLDNDYFVEQYVADATHTAAMTFERRKGNCVSYTNLFVALAREAGLDASFQLVTGRPVWNVESGYLVKNNHINVVLKQITMPGYTNNEMTVDFNAIDMDEDASRRRISDEHAVSLFYANIAIQHLRRQEFTDAFAYLKRAITTAPANQDLWNNLGVLYSVMEQPQMAEASYRTALRLEPRNKTAIAGVAKSLEQQGRLEEAQHYAELARRYQRRNPYYHFAVAQQAYSKNAYEAALEAVNEAIQIKKRSKFYALRAATAEQLGDNLLAEESYRLQDKYRKRSNRISNPLSQRIN
ncbi:MAG: transglutaminase domain-containing protein [Pseudomonadota bacterium]